MNATPYPEVNAVLSDLLAGVRRVLGERYVGLYLYGSLAGGDFNLQRSDIDFVVVTRGILPRETIAALEKMHRQSAASGSAWARKLEGLYMPLAELRQYNGQGPELPTLNEGHFYLAGQGSDWIIQRYTLREHETIVDGPSIKDKIDPISPEALRGAVGGILTSWWAPMLDDPEWIKDAEYEVFAVQSMCRALCTLQTGQVKSKTESAQWAMETLDRGWKGLIAEADAWQRGRPFSRLAEVLALIRYTVKQLD